eukprot:699769-Amphidinium_carterae.2
MMMTMMNVRIWGANFCLKPYGESASTHRHIFSASHEEWLVRKSLKFEGACQECQLEQRLRNILEKKKLGWYSGLPYSRR